MQSCLHTQVRPGCSAKEHRLQATRQHLTRPIQQPLRDVVMHGILDSFRKERGLPIPDQSGSSTTTTTTIAKPQLSKHMQAPANSIQDDDDGDVPCPVECVTEIFTPEQFQQALQDAGPTALVVVDFFKTACGACKFIYPGFVNLCKASNQQQASSPPVVFLKHNVYDDDEGEVTDLCKQYNVRSVPKFIFFRNGQQLESFSTRDKQKVAEAILKHAEPGSVELGDWQ